MTVVVGQGQTADEVARLVTGLQQRGIAVQLQLAGTSPAGQPTPGNPRTAAGAGSGVVGLPDVFVDGLSLSLDRISMLPRLAGDMVKWLRELGDRPGLVAMIAGLLAGFAAAGVVAWFARRFALRLVARADASTDTRYSARLGRACLRCGCDLVGFAAFYLGATIVPPLLLAADAAAATVGTVLSRTVVIYGFYWTFARLLLEPTTAGGPLLAIDNADRNRKLLLLYAAMSAAFFLALRLVGTVASEPALVLGWVYLAGTLINAYKVWWFWTVRRDLAGLFRQPPGEAGPAPLTSRVLAVLLPAIGILLPIALWVILTISAVATQGPQLASAAAFTQVLYFVVPVVAAGASALAWDVMRPAGGHAAKADAARAATSTLAGGATVVVGLFAVTGVWSIALDHQSPQVDAALRSALVASVVLLVGLVILRYLAAFFDAHAPRPGTAKPGEEDEQEATPQSRIATAMPIIRNFALAAVTAIALLVALSKLGVEIAPLLAGAGIIGLAISFGSQALVRDIVSGIFFMADDAFRIGEYIDTGKLKGNVERITLRSLQLRHQNGQIHTIPYGQLASITNFSRDWTTIKFNLRLDRATDIEQTRRLIKKVGQELQADPEIGPDFLLPVKMQGVTDVAENALVIRIKFTAKPARPTYVHRVALRRIYTALTEAGVKFATNAVTVIGHPGDARAAAAAAASTAPSGQQGRASASG